MLPRINNNNLIIIITITTNKVYGAVIMIIAIVRLHLACVKKANSA